MHRRTALFTLIAWILTAGIPSSTVTFAQRRHPPSMGRAEPRPPVRRAAVVFVGGYFYDPFFGPYPWWPRPPYPVAYYPRYDDRAIVRVIATPKDAGVYVDGFYAGTVHDFNDWWQGLPLPPGGCDIVLYLEGYRTIHRRLYLSPGSTYNLRETLEPLPPGGRAEPPPYAAPPPPPPEGSYLPPRTAPRMPPPPYTTQDITPDAVGILDLRVQPTIAEVWIDGERWASSDGGRFVVPLLAGSHRIEVACAGYRKYAGEISVAENETVPFNVSLARERPPTSKR